jgi:hypothetical protein
MRITFLIRALYGHNSTRILHARVLSPARHAERVHARQQAQHVGVGVVHAYAAYILPVCTLATSAQTGGAASVFVFAGNCQLALQL